RLGAFVERGPFGFDRLRPRVVLPPRLVQRRLRARDRLVAARALLGPRGLFLPALDFSPSLCLLERRGGLAGLLIVELAGWFLCSLRRRLFRLGLSFGFGLGFRLGFRLGFWLRLVVSEI